MNPSLDTTCLVLFRLLLVAFAFAVALADTEIETETIPDQRTGSRSHSRRVRSSAESESRADIGIGIRPIDVSRSEMAVRLAQIVNDGYKYNNNNNNKDKDKDNTIDDLVEEYGFRPSDGIYLESGINAVYLAKVGDQYCAAAFRGTTNYQIGDWLTNLYVGPVPVVFGVNNNDNNDNDNDNDDTDNDNNNDGSNNSNGSGDETDPAISRGCDVHGGYHEAYTEFEYRDTVEAFLRECRSDCGGAGGCETVLTGHSQGGGIAAIAALYLKQNGNRDPNQDFDHNSGATATSATATVVQHNNNNNNNMDSNDNDNDSHSPYVITFGAPQSLGAGCRQFVTEDERHRWFRYIMATESAMGGKKLVYDPVPLLYAHLLDPPPPEEEDNEDGSSDDWSDFFDNFGNNDNDNTSDRNWTFARHGGLAYIGHEILLSTEDPSSVLLSEFDGHSFVDLQYIDLTIKAHYDILYAQVLEAQDEMYNNYNIHNNNNSIDDDCHAREENSNASSSVECPDDVFLPSSGFAIGSLCNPSEPEPEFEFESKLSKSSQYHSTCADGTECVAETKGWFWDSARHTCQLQVKATANATVVQSSSSSSTSTSTTTTATSENDKAVAADEAEEPSEAEITTTSVAISKADPTTTRSTTSSTRLVTGYWIVGIAVMVVTIVLL